MDEKSVLAKVFERIPEIGYVCFVLMAIWGGTARYIAKLNKTGRPFSMVELIGEWTISGFAGIVTAYICQWQGLPFALTAAAAGISGHMGGRAIFLFEMYVKRKLAKFMDN